MMDYFNGVIRPLNDELREHIGLRKRSRKIHVDYIGDKGRFIVMNMDYKQGKELIYIEDMSYAEALLCQPF